MGVSPEGEKETGAPGLSILSPPLPPFRISAGEWKIEGGHRKAL